MLVHSKRGDLSTYFDQTGTDKQYLFFIHCSVSENIFYPDAGTSTKGSNSITIKEFHQENKLYYVLLNKDLR